MNRVHRKLEYALIALQYMSKKDPGELTTVKELCQKYKTPFDAMARVLQQMVQGRLLKSEQGAYGGYLILKNLAETSVLELIEKVVGPVEVARCLNEQPEDSTCELRESCTIMLPLVHLNQRLMEFYKNINIDELLKTAEKSEPAQTQRNPMGEGEAHL